MTAGAVVCLALAALSMALDWWAVAAGRNALEAVAKPAVMVALIGVAILADIDPATATPWIVAGLGLGLVGDIALLPRIDRFVTGLTAFLVGHLAYTVAFAHMWSPSSWLLVGAIGLVALVIGVGRPIERTLRGRTLHAPVLAYIAVSGAVVITGSATGRASIVIGTLAFAASDALLGTGRFLRPARDRRLWIHVLYQLGQTAIVLGAVAG